MENLAGVKKCGPVIQKELKAAGIIKLRRIPKLQKNCEVPSPFMGLLIKDSKVVFKLTRAWYYWVVKGDLYSTKVGKKDVRVNGYCGCPSPEEGAFPKREVLIKLGVYKLSDKKHPFGQSPTYGQLARMCNNGEIQAPRFVDTYHIDSQEGLNFFVRTLKEHYLID